MRLCLVAVAVLVSSAFAAEEPKQLPELRVAKTAVLSPSYSCRPKSEKGYEQSALFVTQYSRDRNAPDLLFNGACGSPDEFQGSTAGDDMSLVADLGTSPLEDISAQSAFNLARVAGPDRSTKFADRALVQAAHTYAVLINKAEFRGLMALHVDRYTPNQKVEIRYAVLSYQLMAVRAQAEDFRWDKKIAAGSALRKGLTETELEGIYGVPVKREVSTSGDLHREMVTFKKDGSTLEATMIEGVLVRFKESSD